MTSDVLKELPQPPLRVTKSQPTSKRVAVPRSSVESSLRQSTEEDVPRSNSGLLRRHVASLTRSSRSTDGPSEEITSTSASSNGSSKTWPSIWTTKPKQMAQSEASTSMPSPSGTISPPPVITLNDISSGRPFSTTGCLNIDSSRFSFLDMSNKDHSSDDDTQELVSTPTAAMHDSPDRIAQIVLQPPTPSSLREISMDGSRASSKHDSRGAQSLPSFSPALTSLISSFPNPNDREEAVTPTSSNVLESDEAEVLNIDSETDDGWDGGEIWEVNSAILMPSPARHRTTDQAYLDMGDDTPDDEQGLETLSPDQQNAPVLPRPNQNPPPRPAPTAALPSLPAPKVANSVAEDASTAPTVFSSSAEVGPLRQAKSRMLRRLTLEAAVPPVLVNGVPTTRPAQRPLLLPTLTSSSSAERLAPRARSVSPSSFVTASQTASPVNSMILDPNATPSELVNSLDIPRDAIKQMLETTHHVWRSHNVGPSLNNGATASTYMARSRSFPVLSSLYASDSDKAVEASEGHTGIRNDDQRTSISSLPYIHSENPPFDKQSPGWAISKPDTEHVRAVLSKSDKLRFRQTVLKSVNDNVDTSSTNFSRPIRREGGEAMVASMSMPALSNPAGPDSATQSLLQSPLILKSEADAPFKSTTVDDEEEVLVDSGSESYHAPVTTNEVLSRFKENFHEGDVVPLRSVTEASPVAKAKGRKREAAPGGGLSRRNSDTMLNRLAAKFSRRAPGELHAWSVSVNDKGVPAILPSPSAFHQPNCTLAGKNNATWQCGCRGTGSGPLVRDSISNVPHFGVRALTDEQHSPTRNRSQSASTILDPHQAQLWTQVELSKVLIRKHEEEIAGLQQQVIRISTEMASARPSLSSAFNTPEPPQASTFANTNFKDFDMGKSAPAAVATAKKQLPIISRAPLAPEDKPMPDLPEVALPAHDGQSSASHSRSTPAEERVKVSSMKGSNSLRDRLASLSKISLVEQDPNGRPTHSLRAGHTRFASSTSNVSLGKKFRFPWKTAADNKENLAEPIPFPMTQKDGSSVGHANPTSVSKPLPALKLAARAKEAQPLPPAPVQDSKDKKFPPSSRKHNYDTGSNTATQLGSGRSHARGQSESSSFGTMNSIFSSEGGDGYHSRQGFFPRLGRRWDSVSSRGTNASVRSSADLATLQASEPSAVSKKAIPASSSSPVVLISGKPADLRPSQSSSQLPRRSKTPPPRRSSLRKSSEGMSARSPVPSTSLQSPSIGMAPISEQSEVGSPSSVQRGGEHSSSPVSIVNASFSGPGRMSMSDRYSTSQGLTVPMALPLSSSQVSLISSPHLSLHSHSSQLGGSVDASPRPNKQPLQMGMSHGTLTISRQHPITS